MQTFIKIEAQKDDGTNKKQSNVPFYGHRFMYNKIYKEKICIEFLFVVIHMEH